MTLQSKKYLDDILYSIRTIFEFVEGVNSFVEYAQDKKTKSAVERQLGIIGEAANKYSKIESSEILQNISQIVGLRNRIIHAYDNVDDSVIWVILKKHLPELEKEVLQKLK